MNVVIKQQPRRWETVVSNEKLWDERRSGGVLRESNEEVCSVLIGGKKEVGKVSEHTSCLYQDAANLDLQILC